MDALANVNLDFGVVVVRVLLSGERLDVATVLVAVIDNPGCFDFASRFPFSFAHRHITPPCSRWEYVAYVAQNSAGVKRWSRMFPQWASSRPRRALYDQ